MGTYTSHILVGHGHTFHGGIQPSHQLYLSENSRPAWVLQEFKPGEGTSEEKIIWIPTVERMLEDETISNVLSEAEGDSEDEFVLYDIEEENREKLYKAIQNIDFESNGVKLVITILAGSSIALGIDVLEKYNLSAEVCVSDKCVD